MGLSVHSEATNKSVGVKDVMSKVGLEIIALQNRCRENLGYARWEPSLETRFPSETYSQLLNTTQK